ncbi:hypothetical protein [Butyrivibrio sp. AE3004]|uniref:hypothetical protein n=1 Tax=Butyrivibrio sp. AE3004 TaxID=1506994 RepID=UPI0004944D8D|nr:hypothetical protein [Butyrivibrio sp. AE3004]
MLSEKEIMIIKLGAKMEIGYGRDYSILLGSRELSADRKRLAKLCGNGYLYEDWHDGKKVYFLTNKGLSEVDSHMKRPYNPKGYSSTDHAIYIAELAAYVHLTTGISYESFIFDREMESIEGLKPTRKFAGMGNAEKDSMVHAPDFIVGNHCYEVELNNKEIGRLRQNFEINSKHFEKQVWLVQERMVRLQGKIRALAKEYKCPTRIITVEQLDRFMQSADLKTNTLGRHVDMQLKKATEKNILEELF